MLDFLFLCSWLTQDSDRSDSYRRQNLRQSVAESARDDAAAAGESPGPQEFAKHQIPDMADFNRETMKCFPLSALNSCVSLNHTVVVGNQQTHKTARGIEFNVSGRCGQFPG